MSKYLRLVLVLLVCTYFWYYTSTYTEWHAIDTVNLIFHEAGHSILFLFGMFIHILAGSGFQIILPLLISLYFFWTKQKVSGALCLLWVGQNLLNVSIYTGDALTMQLDLLGGDGVIHDWNYILETLGLLDYTTTIARTIFQTGILTLSIGTILSLYYSWIADTTRSTTSQLEKL